ncbi:MULTISPECIES: type II toxin-antitoxin system RelE/ParE family toxin [Gammaproteobacteria]|uniref:type II toxin-antitoxin system RelE/ParE family toxin n=1 Tax=Gammaproteobacteria TaxID=1236 RepID=UPI001ADBC1B7|nr:MULTISPECIES: type II toxin-antitoxin system RelE/ParE family toxin [Gammaproteobacteria]MBO9484040.1 type II toxin-antitoxin system RelE/ParE family toxin [Salinisphaera sp. G21_0]MBO9497178.1 type II toxin-antitoxin system RelE/ParE family toxin [Thalassotalea sp. G20_0]
MKLRFSRSAVDDLKRLRQFIAEKNPPAAQRMAEYLVRKINNLCHQPNMGVLVGDKLNPRLRDLIIRDYKIRYLADDREVLILKIWHQKEDDEISLDSE